LHDLATKEAGSVLYDFHAPEPPLIEVVRLGAGIRTVVIAINGVPVFVGDKHDIH